jgi:hypothetical protein
MGKQSELSGQSEAGIQAVGYCAALFSATLALSRGDAPPHPTTQRRDTRPCRGVRPYIQRRASRAR